LRELFGRRIAHLLRAIPTHHEHRIRCRRERRLHRALGAQDAGERGIAIRTQLPRHGVERTRELTELVTRKLRCFPIQIAIAEGDGGRRQHPDWIEQ
jgi:hypothetical protein